MKPIHFKMEGTPKLKQLLMKNDYIVSYDLKETYNNAGFTGNTILKGKPTKRQIFNNFDIYICILFSLIVLSIYLFINIHYVYKHV
jgi:hypothetical protein